MTKIILHGGFKPGESQEDDAFFGEILKTAPQNAKVLLVYFAKEEDRIQKNYKEDVEQFTKNQGDKHVALEIARKDDFIQQVLGSDVIYLHGGRTEKLLNALKEFPDFAKSVQGKIIAGDSAGANVLGAVFYSGSMGIGEGLGILPVKMICHYTEENKDKLLTIKPELETIFLKEYETKVVEG